IAEHPARPAMMRAVPPMTRGGVLCYGARRISFQHVHIRGHRGPAFRLERAEQVQLLDCAIAGGEDPQIVLRETKEVTIRGGHPVNREDFPA
ncbi:MAG: hypothetical protein GX493_00555, partial [Firmicutes bacterium]|nr:hypothetical protein [Bacillota bacterium]